jgi:putative PIN family toxin of toxin-antitoxin system
LRVVLDTHILISAFIFPGGPPEAAYRAVLDGRVELVTSPPLLAELGRVQVDKFRRPGSMSSWMIRTTMGPRGSTQQGSI